MATCFVAASLHLLDHSVENAHNQPRPVDDNAVRQPESDPAMQSSDHKENERPMTAATTPKPVTKTSLRKHANMLTRRAVTSEWLVATGLAPKKTEIRKNEWLGV